VPIALADDSAERTAIGRLLNHLNESRYADRPELVSALFVAGADRSEVSRLTTLVQLLDANRGPWMELDMPQIYIDSIRVENATKGTPDRGSAEGEVRYSSVLHGGRVVFVLRREGPDWKIVSFRALGPAAPFFSTVPRF
jgi:hypothetical protein